MEKQQIYIKVKNCPFDLEDDFFKDIPTYFFDNISYVKINPLYENWKDFNMVDIELTEQKINKNEGEFNGFSITPKKDFTPCFVEFIEEF